MSEARRKLIPVSLADLSTWPGPDVEVLNEETRALYWRRRRAIEMYHAGVPFPEILEASGLHRGEIGRLLKRCLAATETGNIFGWFALVKALRVKPYERKSKVVHEPGSGPGGCAGALDQVLSAYPELRDTIEDLYFGTAIAGEKTEARASVYTIHQRFLEELKGYGFDDNDWPFCTANRGYVSLGRYCARLELTERARAVLSRSGREALNRNPVGNGHRTLFKPLRAYTAAQLDFHKVDAASVFVLKNDHGADFEVTLARWHFGLIIDEVSGAALGYCVALELNPSGDSVLEIVQSCLSTGEEAGTQIPAVTPSLIHEIMPELRHQCFSALKMDNAWSNASTEVVNNIMSTVGAAVNFGPVRSWWRRSLIERIFKRLTELGLKRLPSTYGSGPGDTIRRSPNDAAQQFKIQVSDLEDVFRKCIRRHNTETSERGQFTSPENRLRLNWENPGSGLFACPLPHSTRQCSRLLMHQELVTVRGNAKKNIRPFFILGRHRHTNVSLANAFWLIGKKLVVSVNRRLAREVYATVAETGENLGMMFASGPWADSNCSLRDRALIQRSGMAQKYQQLAEDPLASFQRNGVDTLQQTSGAQRRKGSKEALTLAKLERQQKALEASASVEKTQRIHDAQGPEEPPPLPTATAMPPETERRADPFGLSKVPDLKVIWSR